MHLGTMKWWNAAKGFGFIAYNTAQGVKDIFVNWTDVVGHRWLEQGDMVMFDIGQGPRGEIAVNVVYLGG
ncbi:cold shock domain-containing protein [Streptomyces sp. NPDC050636]|uniref:cold-shock protein n=1 Tax=Streptomyces sp. NPDC050636 TaxID=3154510 RepID=UPI00341413DC